MPARTCTVPGCDRPHRANGLCMPHYQAERGPRRRQGAVPQSNPRKLACAVLGCYRNPRAKGMCDRHWHIAHVRDKKASADWQEPTYPPLVRYLEDRRARNIPPEGVLMEGEAA